MDFGFRVIEAPSIPGLSKKQAAQILGLTPTRVDQLMNEGKLPYLSTALGRLIDPEAVEQLKAQRAATRRGRYSEDVVS